MSKETWLKIGSVLIYLFVPAFVIKIFCSFLEILFLVEVSGGFAIWTAAALSASCTLIGISNMAEYDIYVLKQKDK